MNRYPTPTAARPITLFPAPLSALAPATAHMRPLTAFLVGLPLLCSAASAQSTRTHEHARPDVAIGDPAGSRSVRRPTGGAATPAARSGGVSTTPDNQILVELAPEDTTSANLFDLNGRTLVFTPDGHGRYSRSVQAVAWEDNIGPAVTDGADIPLQHFMFDFAGHRWGSFFVSRHGLITFGEPLAYWYRDSDNRFSTMQQIAAAFVDSPTISPLYKPSYGGVFAHDPLARQHVAHWPDRVVVTWFVSEPEFYVRGIPPPFADRFQAVLHADGRIRFSYGEVSVGDGIVGLFFDEEVVKGNLIASIPDGANAELPGHLDLLEAALYESNTDGVILELRSRAPIPNPDDNRYSYRLYFDTDQPYWTGYDSSDMDFAWVIDVRENGERVARTFNGQEVTLLETDAPNLVALLARIHNPDGISAAVIADAAEYDNNGFVRGDSSEPQHVELSGPPQQRPDLSRPDSEFSRNQTEVFHYRGVPDLEEVTCRVVQMLGDGFDVLVFHNESRLDKQENGVAGRTYEQGIQGLGSRVKPEPPCGADRLGRRWEYPNWIYTLDEENLDGELVTFAHELIHTWTAWLSYMRRDESEPLFGNYCACHWRPDLHTPAAFPWRGAEAQSIMGAGSGRYWRDNSDGTYTSIDNYRASGPSWLDLYAMGLASADEVPDMFVLRNLESIDGQGYCPGGRYCDGAVWTGDKEIVSIEQVVAAEGPRRPSVAESQKGFNAGFVYLLEPGQTPDPDMLRLHAEYRDKVIEHWSHVTGTRSRMTTAVPGVANRSPVAVGALADRVVPVDGVAVTDARGAFLDPDGDPLTYKATSSAPAVASVAVSGSTVTVRALAAGTATITVTATDIGGSNTTATLAFRVTVERAPLTTFTDEPILPGVTPVKAVHFTELRERIDLLRDGAGLAPFGWADPVLTAGVTPVRLSHLLELREALAAAYRASGRAEPVFTDVAPMSGTTPIRAVHLTELRAAVVGLQ